MPYSSDFFQVLPDKTPADARLSNIRHLNQHFECPKYQTLEEWEARADWMRRHILVCCGLYPAPEKAPLNAKVFDRIEREGYSVEKACFETFPGFLCTGNLYRPLGKKGPFPGIVSPHGHWAVGRLANEERGSIPGRAINFALQGYVCFTYDMVGYNDSMQVDHARGNHREELWGINQMGLQLWNGIRTIDFLQALEDVDPENIACTGCSGGGTQTFMLTAIEPRIKVSAPVCMVSAYMQGGCLCENAPGLRQNIMNSEIAALCAPRPLLLVSATGDWTSHTPEEEFPDIRSIYKLYGAEKKVENGHFDAGHNYNQDGREAVYAFFRKWVGGKKQKRSVPEIPFQMEAVEDLLLFPDKQLPKGIPSVSEIRESLILARKESLRRKTLASARDLKNFQQEMQPAFEHLLNVHQPESGEVVAAGAESLDGRGFQMEKLVLSRPSAGEQFTGILFHPEKRRANGPAVLVLHPEGKGPLLDEEARLPGEVVQALLDKKMSVLLIDAFLTGEYQKTGGTVGRNLGGLTHWTTYNRTDLAERVQDVLTSITYLKAREDIGSIHLVGLDRAGIWALLACPFTRHVSRTAADLCQLRLDQDNTWLKDLFLPGIRKAGDITTAGRLIAPRPLMLMNVSKKFDCRGIEQAYAAGGKTGLLRVRDEAVAPKAIANYLMSNQ